MDLVWEWQAANELRPSCPMTYRQYLALVRECRECAITLDRSRTQVEELLERLDKVCP